MPTSRRIRFDLTDRRSPTPAPPPPPLHHPRPLPLPTPWPGAAALSVTSVSAANADDHKSFPGSKPTWAKTANDAGTAPADDTIEGEIGFALKDLAGAEALAQAVSTPGSHSYCKTLSPSQWF